MTCSAFAQQALWGGASVESPVVNEDGTVTFRYQAPKAVKVTVSGDFLPTQKMTFNMGGQERTFDAPGVAELKEGQFGIWEYTTDFKVAPEMYTYTFNVDGNTVIDNNNMWVNRDVSSLTSAFIVPGERADLYTIQDVPHGTVSKVWYESATAGFDRRLSVYTPAGYNPTAKTRYPVLYVLHGIGGDEDAWIAQGRAAQILDNLIAQGKAVPMIVVMPYGNVFGSTPSPTTLAAAKMYQKFEQELTECVMPFVEKNFRTKNNRESRAIAGFSRGGGQSLYSVYSNFDKFAYLASYSAYLTPEVMDTYFPDLQSKMSQLKLMWFGVGTSDFLYQNVLDHQNYFDEKGIKYEKMFTEGGHTWMNARTYLAETLQKFFK